MFEQTNWLAVFVAALSSLVVGFVWYNPKVFGTAWMKATGLTPERAKTANMPIIFGITFLMSLVVCTFLSTWVHPDEHLPQFFHGFYHGIMVAGFVAVPAVVTHALFEMKTPAYVFINIGYVFITMAVEAGILFIWP